MNGNRVRHRLDQTGLPRAPLRLAAEVLDARAGAGHVALAMAVADGQRLGVGLGGVGPVGGVAGACRQEAGGGRGISGRDTRRSEGRLVQSRRAVLARGTPESGLLMMLLLLLLLVLLVLGAPGGDGLHQVLAHVGH